MSLKVTVLVEVDHGTQGAMSLELTAPQRGNDNPTRTASEVRRALLTLAGQADEQLLARYGDVEADYARVDGSYTWPLVAGARPEAATG